MQIGFWLKQNFILSQEFSVGDSPVELRGVTLPTGSAVAFTYQPADGLVVLESDQLGICTDLVQHLSTFFNVQHLASEIEMSPAEIQKWTLLLENIRQLQSVRQRLTVDITEQASTRYSKQFNINLIKQSLLRSRRIPVNIVVIR